MATYYPISLPEMTGLLRSDKGWQQAIQGNEVVLNYKLKNVPNVELKVYTGICPTNGQSKKVGADALRVCAVDIINHRGWIKARRVHRVMGWKENLKSRILQVIKQSEARARG